MVVKNMKRCALMCKKPVTEKRSLQSKRGRNASEVLRLTAVRGHVVSGEKHQNNARRWRISQRTRVEADSSAVVFVLWCVTLRSPLGSFSRVTPSRSIRWFMGCILAVLLPTVNLVVTIAHGVQIFKDC